MEKGIVCSLTGDRAAFDDRCDDFESDAKLVVKQKREEQDDKQLKQLRKWTIVGTSIGFGLFILVRIIVWLMKVKINEMIKPL